MAHNGYRVAVFITFCTVAVTILSIQTSQLPHFLSQPFFHQGHNQPSVLSAQQLTPLANLNTGHCPAGFIRVPGNPLYHTSDFCVMKYDAKCALKSDLTTGLQPAHHTTCSGEHGNDFLGTYKNNGPGCACTGDKQIVSTKTGFPITFIALTDSTPNNAKSYCAAMGWHVLTNNEWMTIARNAEQVNSNWCNRDGTGCGFAPGTPGKILANGHNDNHNEASASGDSSGALIAANDDQPCFGTTTDGSNTCGGQSSQKRTLTLNNGEVIWDLAGNVWQWTDNTIMRKDQPHSMTHGRLDQGWIWSEFTTSDPSSNHTGVAVLPTVITSSGQPPNLGYDAFRPSNPTWNSANGVGRIYHYSTAADSDTTEYAYIKGGNWRHGYDSGAFSIHLSPPGTRENIDDVGFRCAAPLQ